MKIRLDWTDVYKPEFKQIDSNGQRTNPDVHIERSKIVGIDESLLNEDPQGMFDHMIYNLWEELGKPSQFKYSIADNGTFIGEAI